MRKSKKNYVIVALIVMLLALAVGYSAFSATLNINGTANMSGNFKVNFVEGTAEVDADHTPATPVYTIGDDGKSLEVAVELKHPGDVAVVTVAVKNEGTIDAKLAEPTVTAPDGIIVTVPAELTEDALAAGETCEFTFTVAADEDETKFEDKKVSNFTITLNYLQDTEASTAAPTHKTH